MSEEKVLVFRHNVLNAVQRLVPGFVNLWPDQVRLLDYYQSRITTGKLDLLYDVQDAFHRRRNGKTTITVAILAAILIVSENQIVLVMDTTERSRARFIGLLQNALGGAKEMSISNNVERNSYEIRSGSMLVQCTVTKQIYESLDFW